MLTLTAKHDLARLQAAGLTVHSADSIAHGDRVTIVVDHDVLTRFADLFDPEAIETAEQKGYDSGLADGKSKGAQEEREDILRKIQDLIDVMEAP